MADPVPLKVGVFKFASCDGCQLSLLDCEQDLLALADRAEFTHFAELSSAIAKGPWDLSFVEGSITTNRDMERILEIREASTIVVAIGACATSGGIQALRNFADVNDFKSVVYAHPDYIDTLSSSTPISEHIVVDYELRGCPVSKHQLLEFLNATLNRRKADLPRHSVCIDCKLRGTPCITVTQGIPCLGPVTQTGCGAICPSYGRGCYGCFGPMESPNCDALAVTLERLGLPGKKLRDLFRSYNAAAEPFAEASKRYD